MHIGIFAERFVGRYGADRVLVILAEQLLARGHQVTLVGVRFSKAVVERFAHHTFRVPDFSGPLAEPRTLKWFQGARYFFARHLPPLDLCIVGSYPFISAIPYLAGLSRGVVFIDFGVVPTFGYPPSIAQLIEGVRANRRANLRHCRHIVPISEFIATSQARPDCQDQVPVTPILLGADHLAKNIGTTQAETPPPAGVRLKRSHVQHMLELLQDRKLVLCLGRWEPGCYKNSQAAFALMRALDEMDPDAALLVLADPYQFQAEPGLENSVFAVGLPSDAEMADLSRTIDAGVSLSLWEGFNLPLVELLYEEKPAFAFNLAAHPEVVIDPAALCADTEEMAVKLYTALRRKDEGGRMKDEAEGAEASASSFILHPSSFGTAPWREKFSWQRFGVEFSSLLEGLERCA